MSNAANRVKTSRSNVMDSRTFTYKGCLVQCYRNKFKGAPIAWAICTFNQWSCAPMKKHSVRWIANNLKSA